MSGNQVNMTTGRVNTSLTNTLYTDGQLAVYEIDQVLLAEGLFRPPAPAPPPKTSDPSDAPSGSNGASDDSSDAKDRPHSAQKLVSFGVAVIVILHLWL